MIIHRKRKILNPKISQLTHLTSENVRTPLRTVEACNDRKGCFPPSRHWNSSSFNFHAIHVVLSHTICLARIVGKLECTEPFRLNDRYLLLRLLAVGADFPSLFLLNE